jgi:long-chain acyl-CoA synthetase
MEEKIWHRHRWPAGVARHPDFPVKPVPALLEETAKTNGALPYLVFQGRHLSFAEVDRRANQVAHFLRTAGVGKGDRVALSLPNIPQFPIVYFGILKAGAVAVPCNPLYKERELRFLLTDSGAKVLFVMDHPEFYPIACQAVADTGITQLVYCNVGPYLPRFKAAIGGLLGKIPAAAHHPLGTSLESAIIGQPTNALVSEIDPKQDPAVIIYTGGTTGTPKGAVLTHYNLVSNVIAVDEWVRLVHTPGGQPERFRRKGFHTMMGSCHGAMCTAIRM